MNRFRTIAVTAIAGFVLVACGPAASGSESSSGQASQAESRAAQASGGGILPSFAEGAVAELEALIPDTVGGVTMSKTSTQGNDYLVSSGADPAIVQFLQDLGVSPSDVSMAVGTGFSADSSTGVVILVFRAAGADSARLVSAFKAATDADSSSPLAWSSTTLGGKQVEQADNGGQTTYLYVKGDVLFFISATDTTFAEEILSGLP